MQLQDEIGLTRTLLFQDSSSAIAPPFLVILMLWVSVIFFGFGIQARAETTAIVTLLVGAASMSAALYLIMELNAPYYGFFQLSDEPLRRAIVQLGDHPAK